MPLFDRPGLGLQVLVYDPVTGVVEDLTEDTGRGFGNSSLRYAWSMEQSDGDIFIGTNLLNPDALGFFKLSFRAQNGLLTPDALRRLGVPYTDEQIADAQESVSGKYEIDALVAYLQALGKTHSEYSNKR